jgi:hypothetical protein
MGRPRKVPDSKPATGGNLNIFEQLAGIAKGSVPVKATVKKPAAPQPTPDGPDQLTLGPVQFTVDPEWLQITNDALFEGL